MIPEEPVHWNRQKQELPNVDEPTNQGYCNLPGVPQPRITSEDKAKAMEDSIDWLRSNKPVMENVDEPTVEALSNLAGLPVPKRKLQPEDKTNVVDKCVSWLRNNEPNPNDIDDPTVQALANIAGVPFQIPVGLLCARTIASRLFGVQIESLDTSN